MVGYVRFAGKRDGHYLLRLIVVERLQNELVEIVDVDGSAATFVGGGFSGMFGQGVSWRTMASRDAWCAARTQAEAIDDANGGFAREWRLRRSDRAAGEGK
jgi:hypothetical protein